MKILIITHSGDLTYGAAKSLGYILRNSDLEFDLIYEHYLLKKVTNEELKKYVGDNIQESYVFHLPYVSKIVLDEGELRFLIKVRRFLSDIKNKIQYFRDKKKIYRLIELNMYDFVYLNSITLFPLITNKYNFIMHIREIYNGVSKRDVVRKLNQVKKLIFIDQSTKDALNNIKVPSIILNNPFDMSNLKYLDRKTLDAKYNVVGKTVFSIIGNVVASKGIDYVINEFIENKNQNSILQVVGSGDDEYMKLCTSLAKNDVRVRFLGQENNIDEIYLISDYIVRGEPLFAIGRTVYEALYSDTGVIIPGYETDMNKMFELEKYRKKIHLYKPRSNELRICFQNLAEIKIQKEQFNSNIKEYMEDFRKVFMKKDSE